MYRFNVWVIAASSHSCGILLLKTALEWVIILLAFLVKTITWPNMTTPRMAQMTSRSYFAHKRILYTWHWFDTLAFWNLFFSPLIFAGCLWRTVVLVPNQDGCLVHWSHSPQEVVCWPLGVTVVVPKRRSPATAPCLTHYCTQCWVQCVFVSKQPSLIIGIGNGNGN